VARTPTCPECLADVLPSWDFCHACGYDPSGLRPTGWGEPDDAESDDASGVTTAAWVAPAPTATRTAVRAGAVSRLVDPGAARPQEMHDPDWVRAPEHRGLPIPAIVGLVAVVTAAVVGLVVVTLMVLHRPIGTTNDGAQGPHGAPTVQRVLLAERAR